MSDAFAFNYSGLEKYSPFDGGDGGGVVPAEGTYTLRIDATSLEKSKDGTKGMVKIKGTITDPDGGNTPVVARPHYYGVDRNGENLARQFFDVLSSVGYPESELAKFASFQGQPFDVILNQLGLVGKTCSVRAKYDVYNNRLKTVIEFVTPKVAEQDVKSGQARGRKATEVTPADILKAKVSTTQGGFGGMPMAAPQFGGAAAAPGFAPAAPAAATPSFSPPPAPSFKL